MILELTTMLSYIFAASYIECNIVMYNIYCIVTVNDKLEKRNLCCSGRQ